MSESILIVDDDPTFNAVLTRALVRRGLDAHGVLSAADALAFSAANLPARVVLDLNLDGA